MAANLKKRLKTGQVKDLQFISTMIAKGESTETVNILWEKFLLDSKNDIKSTKKVKAKLDINELIQHVLNESFEETNIDVQRHVKKIELFNNMKMQMHEQIRAVRETMENYISSMEEDLSKIGDDAQLANIDMQNMLQKQQQMVQSLSNISKTLHDTAMAVIRKIG